MLQRFFGGIASSAALGVLAVAGAVAWMGPSWSAGSPQAPYRIETLAGNGVAGQLPEGGGSAREVPVDLPFGVENGPGDGLFITSVGTLQVLRLERKSGRLTAVVGNGRRGYSGDGGPAAEAALSEPYEVRFDSRGSMLILEMQNHLLRRVVAGRGTIETVSGDGTAGYRGDGGPAREARFRAPHSIALDRRDNIYISDLSNHRVRRIDARSGRIETVLGNGERALPKEGGLAREEPFMTPQGLVVRDDRLWIASVSGHSIWRLDLKTGRVHRVAGTGRRGHTGDGGDPLEATFDGPRGMMMSSSGILYLAEGESNVIRAVDPEQRVIRTIAGVGPERQRYAGDGIPATTAPIWQPHGVCAGPRGSLIFSDTKNHRVRILRPLRGDSVAVPQQVHRVHVAVEEVPAAVEEGLAHAVESEIDALKNSNVMCRRRRRQITFPFEASNVLVQRSRPSHHASTPPAMPPTTAAANIPQTPAPTSNSSCERG